MSGEAKVKTGDLFVVLGGVTGDRSYSRLIFRALSVEGGSVVAIVELGDSPWKRGNRMNLLTSHWRLQTVTQGHLDAALGIGDDG